MAVENFFISTAFRIGDFVKYFTYPAVKAGSMFFTHGNERKSDLIAGTAGAGTYGGLTAHYTGMELENYDRLVRMAFAAEKGVDPKDIKASDYLDSENPIIRHRAELGAQLMKIRYPASALPLLPSAIDYALDHIPLAQRDQWSRWRMGGRPAKDAPAISHLINMNKVDNHIVYAAFAALYIYEQFVIRKSGIYDVAKVQETKQDVGRKEEADDLIGIFNRGREDAGKGMILGKAERNALWPILEKIAEKMQQSERFDLPEVVYLIGLDKVNPFAKDAGGNEIKDRNGHLVVDPEAVKRAYAEIDRVDELGLAGIAREKMQKRLEQGMMPTPEKPAKTHVSRLNRTLLDTQFGFARRFTPDVAHPSEEISSRDPIK
jgi:hypothetical protein